MVKADQRPNVEREVIDVGAGDNPDPRASYTADLYYDGADFQFDIRDEWPFEDGQLTGVVMHHVIEHVEHDDVPDVLSEVGRVIRDDGWVEIAVPVGCNARADPTHRSIWVWRTPDLYSDDQHWTPSIPLELVSKRLNVWMIGQLGPLTPFVRIGARYWPHEGWYELPGATGELVCQFQKVDRDR